MHKEAIFNIFLLCESAIITEIGFRVHKYIGSDEEKMNFLISQIEADFLEMDYLKISENFMIKLPTGEEINGLTHERYNNLLHNGIEGILFEPIFQLFNASKNPLLVSTMVIDGKIKIIKQKHFEPFTKTDFIEKIGSDLSAFIGKEKLVDEQADYRVMYLN